MGPEEVERKVREHFEKVADAVDVHFVKGSEVEERANEIELNPRTLLIIAGGDGTITTCVRCLREETEAIAILPAGTMNLFAGDLGLPDSLDEALESIASGEAREVDLAEINGRLFTTNAHIGLYARVGQKREDKRGQPAWRRWPKLAAEALRILLQYPLMEVKIETEEGVQQAWKTRLVTVTNNIYDCSEPGRLPSRTRLDRGELGVYILDYQSRLKLLLGFTSLLTGNWSDNPHIKLVRTRRAIINTGRRRSRNVLIDGELLRMKLPLHVRCVPKALRVVAPRQGDRESRTVTA